MTRLAVVTSHPIQYQVPWFQALAAVTDLTVFFCHRQDARGQAAAGFDHEFDWDIPLLDGYRYEWLRNVSAEPGVDAFAGCDTPEIAARLTADEFDACIVSGWYLKSYLQALRACRSHALPVLMRGDSHLRMPRGAFVRVAKYVPYRWMLSGMAAHLYVGQANRAYLEHYGVPASRLFFAPHFVDTDRFGRAAHTARSSGQATAIRAEIGAAPDAAVFAFAGKLIAKKRPMDFVDALGRLHAQGQRVAGLVVGSGPLEGELRARARQAGMPPIRFAGFRNQSEIPAWYAAADALVLPSDGRETWGLVANEAMACGLPVVLSDAVGAADDLARAGAGATYPMGDVDALALAMSAVAGEIRADASAVRDAVSRRISTYSCAEAVRGTLAALDFIQGTDDGEAGLVTNVEVGRPVREMSAVGEADRGD